MPGQNEYSRLPQQEKKEQTNNVNGSEQTFRTNDEIINHLNDEIKRTEGESDKDRKKRERREKWSSIISGIGDAVTSLSNLYFTTKGAPSMYDGKNTLSAKNKERIDKAKAERDALRQEHLNYLQKRDELLQAREKEAWQRQQAENTAAFQREQFETQKNQWERAFEYNAGRDNKNDEYRAATLAENKRQHDDNVANQNKNRALDWSRLEMQRQQSNRTFNLGQGMGNVTLTPDKHQNPEIVGRIFRTLPDTVREQYQGQPIYGPVLDSNGQPKVDRRTGKPMVTITGYGVPDTETMLKAIGDHVQDSPDTRRALLEIAGDKKLKINGF